MLRAIALLMCGLLICVLVGCGGGQSSSDATAVADSGGAAAGGGAAPGGSEGTSTDPMAGMGGAQGPPGGMQGPPGGMEGMAPGGMPPGMQGMGGPGGMAPGMEGMEAEYGMEEAYEQMEEEYQYNPEEYDSAEMEGAYGRGGYPGAGGEFGEYNPEEMADAYGGEYGRGEYGPRGGAPGSQGPPKGFDGMAQVAFQAGKEKEALQYLYAHALTDSDGAADLLPSIQWVAALKRPVMAVRFGIAVDLTSPPTVKDFKPIGSKQQLATGGRGRESAGGEYGGEYSPDAGGAEYGADFEGGLEGGFRGGGRVQSAVVSKYAGDFGDKILAEFAARLGKGSFGQVLQNAHTGGGGAGRRGGFDGGESEFEAGDFEAMESGGPGFGGGYPGAEGGAYGPGARQGGDGDETSHIIPGLTFVGVGKERELVAQAKEQGIDVLLLFKVSIKLNFKLRQVLNETEVDLLDVATRTRLERTKVLNNVRVQIAREKEEDDGLDKEVEKLFTFIDANLVMSPLPDGLNENNVLRRASTLAAAKHDELLPVLTEVRFWNRKDLLREADMAQAFSQLLGSEAGTLLASGTPKERRQAIASLLPAGHEKIQFPDEESAAEDGTAEEPAGDQPPDALLPVGDAAVDPAAAADPAP